VNSLAFRPIVSVRFGFAKYRGPRSRRRLVIFGRPSGPPHGPRPAGRCGGSPQQPAVDPNLL